MLPLGIDLGTSRARIAAAEVDSHGDIRLKAVVSRDLPADSVQSGLIESPDLVSAVLDEMLCELGTRERRCVFALGTPSAVLRVMRFPKMSWAERIRAAKFEAQRFVGWNIDEENSIVRVHPLDRAAGVYGVGAVRRDAVDSIMSAVRGVRLKPVSIDHDALALRRALPFCDAILDVGADRSILHAFSESGPLSWIIPCGGVEVTRGISRDLCIDYATAERRKRILGAAGAGAASRDELVVHLRDAIEKARSRVAISRIALTGNGSRLPRFPEDLEAATGASVEMPVAQALFSDAYPEDVIRSAAPDWTLAVGLAMWGAAA